MRACFSYILFAFLFISSTVQAEVYECEGKWTNKPCAGVVTRSLEEVGASASVDENTKLLREKTSALHELRMKELRARSDFEIQYNIGEVESFCLKSQTSLEDCEKKILHADSELDRKISLANELRSKKRELELQEEANRIQEERNKIEREQSQVTIIEQQRPVIVLPRDRVPHSMSGYGASIGVHGNVAGADVHVQVSGAEESVVTNSNATVISVPRDPAPVSGNSRIVVYDKSGRPRKIEGVTPGPFAK